MRQTIDARRLVDPRAIGPNGLKRVIVREDKKDVRPGVCRGEWTQEEDCDGQDNETLHARDVSARFQRLNPRLTFLTICIECGVHAERSQPRFPILVGTRCRAFPEFPLRMSLRRRIAYLGS